MTIEKAIKHAEEVAKEQYQLYSLNKSTGKGCLKCAKEHSQLAEWLKDYKRLLEQEPCDDAISRQVVKEQMIKYGFHAPDMTVTEFVEDLPPVNP